MKNDHRSPAEKSVPVKSKWPASDLDPFVGCVCPSDSRFLRIFGGGGEDGRENRFLPD